jgi:RNA polymerase sigma-70 factor (ECF subfamily)
MPTAEPFDSVLIAARSGAEWAWARLVNGIDPTLRGYVRGQGGTDLDDLVSETWLHVARGIHRFEGDESQFRSWVFTIAHHRIIDERRRFGRKPSEFVEDDVLDQAGPVACSAEAEVMDRLRVEELQRVLERLSPDQREVVTLRFIGGFTITEIAGIMGRKPGAVQALQRRAFRRLERFLR